LQQQVSFHVQLQRSHHRARLFNLSEAELRRQLFDPWSQGTSARVGDRDWDPAECRLVVVESRSLEPSELALGRGWRIAEKIGRDVTAELLARERQRTSGDVGVMVETAAARAVVTSLLAELGLRAVDWNEPGVSAVVIVVEERLTAQRAFNIGLALGALGDRAILVQLGRIAPPPELSHIEVMRLEAGEQASLAALARRLRVARAGASKPRQDSATRSRT
jgi:hypothetical protein